MTLEDTRPRPSDSLDDAPSHRLRTGLYVLPHGDDEIFVRDGSRAAFSKIVRDPARRRLLTRIVQASSDPISATQLAHRWGEDGDDVAEIMTQLADSGVLVAIDSPSVCRSVLVIGHGVLAETLALLAESDPRIEIDRHPELASVEEVLETASPDADRIVAVVGDALDPALCLDANAVSLAYGIPAVYAHVDGPEAVVGPFVIPGETACYLCHDLQDEGARHLRDEYIVYKDSLRRGVPGPGADAAVAALAAAWLRLALATHDRDARGFLDQRVLRVETSRMEVMSHRLLTIPRCPACATSRAELEHTFL